MTLQVSHLYKSYNGQAVLEDVSFTAGPGALCIMGPSGQGKTTLLRLILGLERPDSGAVEGVEGVRFSAVFQEDRLLLGRTALENLRFVQGSGFDAASCRALLEELGLTDIDAKPVRDFSGGMRRRTALARALCVPFDVLILDEPFAGLDGESRRRCLEAVRRRTEGKPVLLATHDPADAADLGARVLRLGSFS